MKTRLHTLITGLLMAVCITGNGQEIVSTFTSTSTCWYGDIVETSDGNFIIGNCISLFNDREYIVYKVTREGAYRDSICLYNIYGLLEVPNETDLMLLYGFSIESNIYHLTLTLIDASLNVVSETSIPIGECVYEFWDGTVFVAPNGEILFPYSIDVFHIMHIGLDGIVLEDKAFPEIPCGTWDPESTNDSEVYYSDINVFTKSPLTYHCLGFYRNSDGTTIMTNHILDENLNIIENIEYDPYEPNSIFGPENYSSIATLGTGMEPKKTYLSTSMRFSNSNPASTIIRYDINHHPDAALSFASNTHPGFLKTKGENILYFSLTYYETFITLYRLDGNLTDIWHIGLPNTTSSQTALHTMKFLRNGDIIIGCSIYVNNGPLFQYFIIHDSTLDSTKEIVTTNDHFKVFPNPVKDALSLEFTDGAEPKSVELYDIAGRLVSTKPNNLESIDMSAMPVGVYMLRVTMKDGSNYNEKILKE